MTSIHSNYCSCISNTEIVCISDAVTLPRLAMAASTTGSQEYAALSRDGTTSNYCIKTLQIDYCMILEMAARAGWYLGRCQIADKWAAN